MPNPLHKLFNAILSNKSIADIPAEYKQLATIAKFEHDTISKHISFYNQLPDAGKLRFLKRVYYFKNSKNFHYVKLEPKPEMPVLVSAAAVQVTFGLRAYLLPFFKDIYLMPGAYHSRNLEGLNVGHVSTTGIYISWKHFLEGFKDDKDGVNTALHEMAHALRHQHRMKEFGIDKKYHADFAKYTQQYGPALVQALLHRRSILRNYAFTNFEEFWAVSVEAFFEIPEQLKSSIPGLYNALCRVLNQDLLSGAKTRNP